MDAIEGMQREMIGNVTIDENGVGVAGGDGRALATLRADAISVTSTDKGGILLLPGEYVMNDAHHDQSIRMRTWSEEDGSGVSSIEVRARGLRDDTIGVIGLAVGGGVTPYAVLGIDAADGTSIRLPELR